MTLFQSHYSSVSSSCCSSCLLLQSLAALLLLLCKALLSLGSKLVVWHPVNLAAVTGYQPLSAWDWVSSNLWTQSCVEKLFQDGLHDSLQTCQASWAHHTEMWTLLLAFVDLAKLTVTFEVKGGLAQD